MTPEEKKLVEDFNDEVEGRDIEMTLLKTSHEQSGHLERFCEAFSESAPAVRIKKEQADDDSELPALVAGDRLFWRAVPSAKEMAPFLESLKFSGGLSGNQKEDLQARLSDLSLAGSFDVFISPHCPFCPLAVGTLAPLALASELVRVTVIDAALFPETAAQRGVRSVPATFLDDAFSWTGAVELNEIVDVLKNRDPSQLSAESLKNMIHEGMAKKVAEMMERKGEIFPAFLELLTHEKWTVRLGAMVAAEELAALDSSLALKLVEPLWEKFRDVPEPVRGDLLYIIGETGDEGAVSGLESVLDADHGPEVKEAAREAIDEIRGRFS